MEEDVAGSSQHQRERRSLLLKNLRWCCACAVREGMDALTKKTDKVQEESNGITKYLRTMAPLKPCMRKPGAPPRKAGMKVGFQGTVSLIPKPGEKASGTLPLADGDAPHRDGWVHPYNRKRPKKQKSSTDHVELDFDPTTQGTPPRQRPSNKAVGERGAISGVELKSGFAKLLKRTGMKVSWPRRYIVMSSDTFLMYRDDKAPKALKTVSLGDNFALKVPVEAEDDPKTYGLCFQVTYGRRNSLVFKCDSKEDVQSWLDMPKKAKAAVASSAPAPGAQSAVASRPTDDLRRKTGEALRKNRDMVQKEIQEIEEEEKKAKDEAKTFAELGDMFADPFSSGPPPEDDDDMEFLDDDDMMWTDELDEDLLVDEVKRNGQSDRKDNVKSIGAQERSPKAKPEQNGKRETDRKGKEDTEKAKAGETKKTQSAADKKKAEAEAEKKAKEDADKAKSKTEKKANEKKAKSEPKRKEKPAEAERKSKAEADKKATDKKTKAEAAKKEKRATAEADKKVKEAADKKQKEEADRKAKLEADKKAKEAAEQKANAEAEKKANAEAERKAKAEAEKKAKAEAEKKAKAEAEKKAKAEAEKKANAEAEKKAKAEAEKKAKAEAEKKAKAEAEKKAKEAADKNVNDGGSKTATTSVARGNAQAKRPAGAVGRTADMLAKFEAAHSSNNSPATTPAHAQRTGASRSAVSNPSASSSSGPSTAKQEEVPQLTPASAARSSGVDSTPIVEAGTNRIQRLKAMFGN